MKIRKSITTGILTLAVLSPTATAFASDKASPVQVSDTSTTVPTRKDAAKAAKFRADMKAWQEALRAWVTGRASAMKAHREALADAGATMKDAVASATTKDARRAAMEAFKDARESAKSKLDAAIKALGDRPIRPTK